MKGDQGKIWRAKLRAHRAARELIDRYAIEAPEHILLRGMATDLGVSVVEGPLYGATARLAHSGRSGRIRVSSEIDNEGRKRFSIAHELGHLLLKHPGVQLMFCQEDSMSDFSGSRILETEANFFAVELLLPQHLVRRHCQVSPVDLRPIIQLAADFRTSITSTAIRLIQLSAERCAVVYSEGGTVKWWVKSESFPGWLRRRGARVDADSVASLYFRDASLPEMPCVVPSDAWLEVDSAESFTEMMEHSMAIPTAEGVLTVLWVEEDFSELGEDEDDPEDEWNPYDARFRKHWPR